jgi:hypothetical protein
MLSPHVVLSSLSHEASGGTPEPAITRIAPPKRRFLDCKAYDLRLSEINELLIEYKRVVDALYALDVFEEEGQ